MPLSKQYGINGTYTEVIHNSDLDTTLLSNTCQGVTSGPNEGEGWSIPPPRSGHDGVDSLRTFYPAQFPYFRDVSTEIKLSGYDFSMYHKADLVYPLITSNKFVLRSEYYTRHPEIQRKKQAFKFSFYRLNDPPHPLLRCIIWQSHTGSGSPAFSINEGRQGWIEFRMQRDGSNAGTFFFPIAEFTRETWHEITVFVEYGAAASGEDVGRATVWYGDKLARFHVRGGSAGSHTYTKAVVNQNSDSAYGTNPNLGTTPMSTVDDGTPVTLFDWHGFTFPTGASIGSIQQKWGFYSSDRGDYCRPISEAIDRLESELYTHDEAILVNHDDPESSLYMPPNQRVMEMYTHVRFAYWGEGETDEDIWKLLNDGASPLEAPSDFTWNHDPEPPSEFTFSVTVNDASRGSITSSQANGAVATGTTINLTATPNEGFVFSAWRRDSASGQLLSSNTSYSFQISENITIVAVFNTPPQPSQSKKFFAKKKNQPIT